MPPPTIIENPMEQTIPPEENVTFVCVGEGYGLIDVVWRRGKGNNERSPPKKSIVITINNNITITSTLTIPDLVNDDRGNYRCRYNNSGGETDSEIVKLTVKGK